MRKFFSFLLLLFTTASLNGGELQEDINESARILRDFKINPGIPERVLTQARGIAILHLVKAGLVVSGTGGSGLVMAHNNKGWSAPSGISIGGAGIGLQVGAEVSDMILVLNTDEALNLFAKGGHFSLTTDLQFVTGPVGEVVEFPKGDAYLYMRTQGLVAGVSLEGTLITEREEVNREFYRKNLTAAEILSGSVPRPESAKELYVQLGEKKSGSKFTNHPWFWGIGLAFLLAFAILLFIFFSQKDVK